MTLAAGTQYFFYENALIPGGTLAAGAAYSGGRIYFAGSQATNFFGSAAALDFTVNGTAVNGAVVPEPASLAMLGLGLVGAGVAARMRRRA